MLSQPVYRLLTVSFIIVALLPVVMLSVNLYHAAWKNAWREISEKHRLLALSLALPIQVYVEDHRRMLAVLAGEVGGYSNSNAARSRYRSSLRKAMSRFPGFSALALVDEQGGSSVAVHADIKRSFDTGLFAGHPCVLRSLQSDDWALCGVEASRISRASVFVITQPLHDAAGRVAGVLVGELGIEHIEALRREVRFGEEGHSAIVDARGHVIAHPNAQWMRERRDISGWPIVGLIMQGRSGVTQFYSPFAKKDMVAGYAPVPGVGWGVMVPQPRAEVAAQVRALMLSHLIWGAVGLVLALSLAILLVRWITRPIKSLASAASELDASGFVGELPAAPEGSPLEVRQLSTALRSLIGGLQGSRQEVHALNASLQKRVEEATRALREANARLERLASVDHLTALYNRRHFEQALSRNLVRRASDRLASCLMLIDIDNFKDINDKHGHAGGDAALKQVANLLNKAMRAGDLAARYGGDEFVAYMHCAPDVAVLRAQQIRAAVEYGDIRYRDAPIAVTVSIGIVEIHLGGTGDIDAVLRKADGAMYEAKRAGRNQVVHMQL